MPKPAIFQLILLVNSLFSGQFPNILFCIFSCENLGYHRYFLTYVAMMHWKFHTKVLKFCFRAYALYFSEKFRELVGEIKYAYDWSSHWPSPSLLRSLETCRFSIEGSSKLRSWLRLLYTVVLEWSQCWLRRKGWTAHLAIATWKQCD